VEDFFKDPGDELTKREKEIHSDPEVTAWETVVDIARDFVPSHGKGRQ
jgi:hypothetical protein